MNLKAKTKEEKAILYKKIIMIISTLFTIAGFLLLGLNMVHHSKNWFPILLCFAISVIGNQLRSIF